MSEHTRQRPPHPSSDDEPATGRPLGWRVVAEPSPSGWYGHLTPLARALGIENPGGTELRFRVNGTPVRVALAIDSGRVVGCTIRLQLEDRAPGPAPTILFRDETDTDREGKELGIAREVQAGFDDFDRAVYVDNDASEADVHRFLEKEATRTAVLDLLGHHHCTSVKASRRELVASLRAPEFDAARLVPALQDLLVVARARAPRERGAERRGRWLVFATWGLAAASGAGLYGGVARWPPTDAGFVAVGCVAGLVLGSCLVPWLRRAVAGDAGSFRRFLGALAGLLVGAAAAGAALVPAVNGALDWREAREVHGVVTSVGPVDPRKETVGVVIEWADGRVDASDLPRPAFTDMAVRQVRHPGALGVEWREPPTAVTPVSHRPSPRP